MLGTDCNDPDEIEINTLEASLFSDTRNDVLCNFRGQLIVLIEHQSTLNENMPLRLLFYSVELLRILIDDRAKLYRKYLLKFPKLKFFVVYNGSAAAPERRIMKLSEAFGGDDTLELKAEFLNVNAGNNRELIARSIDLNWYCAFVERVKFNQSQRDTVNRMMQTDISLNSIGLNTERVAIVEAFTQLLDNISGLNASGHAIICPSLVTTD